MKRLGMLLLLVIGVACSRDASVAPRGFVPGEPLLTTLPPTVDVIVEAVTYGPNGELVTPPSCSRTVYNTDSTRVPAFADLNYDGIANDSTWMIDEQSYSTGCGLQYDPGGQVYDGGMIHTGGIVLSYIAVGPHLQGGTMAESRRLSFRWPVKLALGVYFIYGGYDFLYWDVTPQSGAAYRTTELQLTVEAATAGQRYVAVFKKSSASGGSGNGNGNGSCADPSLPGC